MSSSKYGHFQIYIPTYLIIFRRYGLKLHVKFSEPHHFENLHTYPCDELISGRPLSQSSFPTRETSDLEPKLEETIPSLPIFTFLKLDTWLLGTYTFPPNPRYLKNFNLSHISCKTFQCSYGIYLLEFVSESLSSYQGSQTGFHQVVVQCNKQCSDDFSSRHLYKDDRHMCW